MPMRLEDDESKHRPLVLVADDDPIARLLARGALEQAGFAVEEADDGTTALAAFRRSRPDVVLLDVLMGEMDGFEACMELRSLPMGAHTPVLMITGLDDVDSINRAYEVGATDFVSKPINWTILGHRVRYMLRSSENLLKLRRSEARLWEAQRIARLGNWSWDARGNRIRWSEENLRIFAMEEGSFAGTWQAFLKLVHPEDRTGLKRTIKEAIRTPKDFSAEYRVRLADETIRIVATRAEVVTDAQGVSGFRGIHQDITERKQAEARIRHLAHHDVLTDLPNRLLFADRLTQAQARARRDETMLAVLCLDLNRFKDVNDTLGHAAGDLLLKALAERLQGEIREADTLARLGGDEFAIIQTGLAQPRGADELSRRLIEAVAEPFDIGGHTVVIGVSIGIAVFPMNGSGPADLLKNADLALYRSKAEGRDGYRFFEEEMNARLQRRKVLEHDLRRALAEGQFELHYQPQIELGEGRVVGLEALLRWRHPDRGLVSPAEFIPLAEETGLILPLGEWALRAACVQAVAWPHIRMSVNLSPVQFRHSDLVGLITQALEETGLEPRRLELEITEGVLLQETEAALSVLARIRALGVRIAMDDFGTGYSSLSYLQRFPFDKIKIDQSFVRRLEVSKDAAAIVRAVLGLGNSLGIHTNAEGVETKGQLAFLRTAGCEEVQGFYFSPPVAAADLEPLLADRERAA